MKRCLLALLPLLISGPVAAAEVELWQGLWSGMTKAQVEQRIKAPYEKCETDLNRLYCDSSRRLTLGDNKAGLRTVFVKGKLTAVNVSVRVNKNCKVIEDSGRSREQIVADAQAYMQCLKPYEDKDQQQLAIVITALKAKYGEPSRREKLTNLPEWSIKGTKIAVFYPITGFYGVSYIKDETYGSL